MVMDRLFGLMKEKEASDLFLAVNSPIQIKIHGQIVPINQQKLDNAAIQGLLAEVASIDQLAEFERSNELNIGIRVSGIGSFRLSAFRQRGSVSIVIRYIPYQIPTIESLHIPMILAELILEKRGSRLQAIAAYKQALQAGADEMAD